MEFYYQDKPLNEKLINLLKIDGLEFSYEFWKKVSCIQDCYAAIVQDEGIQKFGIIKDNSCWNVERARLCEKIIKKVNFEDYLSQMSPEKIALSHEILKDVFNLKVHKKILDKKGEQYDLMIVDNADISIGDCLIIDQVFLLKDTKVIGYLKAKYATEKTMTQFGLTGNFKTDPFFNKATTDYSLLTPEYQNLGLGYQMYFHIAQYLNQKGIQFRESINLSPKAKRIWQKMEEHWPESIEEKKIKFGSKVQSLNFLKIGQNHHLCFENEKPVQKIII